MTTTVLCVVCYAKHYQKYPHLLEELNARKRLYRYQLNAPPQRRNGRWVAQTLLSWQMEERNAQTRDHGDGEDGDGSED